MNEQKIYRKIFVDYKNLYLLCRIKIEHGNEVQ